MRNTNRRRARAALMTVAVALLATGASLPRAPIPAPTLPGETRTPGARIWISVVRGEDPDGADRDWAVLTCGPDGGTHPDAAGACATLRGVRGRLGALPGTADRVCAKIYAPVVAEAMGRWHGRLVEYRRTYANDCLMEAATARLFALGGR